MTHREKIESLKNTIKHLFEKEGRSKVYISDLLEVNRKVLSEKIIEWGFEKANISKLTPSNQKFANSNKNKIISMLMNDTPVSEIAKTLNVGRDYLQNIIDKTKVINDEFLNYKNRKNAKTIENSNKYKTTSRDYDYTDIDGEEWSPILGYEDYHISNMGRVRKFVSGNDDYFLLKLSPNVKNNRLYVRIKDKNLQVSRLVGFYFVDGYSEVNCTIEHVDNDVSNNRFDNLKWVSQSENNHLAYEKGRENSIPYSSNGKFKSILLNGKYEFKTIIALSKFLNVSETQVNRYINNETKTEHKIEFIY